MLIPHLNLNPKDRFANPDLTQSNVDSHSSEDFFVRERSVSAGDVALSRVPSRAEVSDYFQKH